MSFGYDSAVFNKSAADIDKFADQSLRELLGKRCEPGEQARPLLFLCYSLGGIVFKKSFPDRCEGLKIVSFYETRQLSGTGIMILSKVSALLFRSNETSVPLNTDYRSLCRFSTTEDDSERLNLLLSNLKDLANQIIAQHRIGTLRTMPPPAKLRLAD
ncbi:hypothetical protein Daesc_010117 [Daldinia eschscholtzii]|uniref:Uncharacterized protein n=1 Tax=Daldinia eschscholtzii TaxID=292717 RepID=A0AAX6M823_9PEZI